MDFYKEETEDDDEQDEEEEEEDEEERSSETQDMLIEVVLPPNQNLPLHQDNTTPTNHSKPPTKKRAETWAQDETRTLISLRRELDCLFNTSKSNKHLWDQISVKMREKGFDRSPTMCTDKWRNLLKEYKKARHHYSKNSRSSKMSCYKEIEEILKERTKNLHHYNNNSNCGNNSFKSPSGSSTRVESYVQFSDKGIDDTSISFGSLEASGRPTLNLERRLDRDGNPLAITAADTVQANGVPPWSWRDAPGNGVESHSCGRVITVKWGDYTRRIGIDANVDAIKDAIKAVFGLRTQRAFWLEDEDGIIRCIDRDMPLGDYNLRLDEGIAIKICLYDDSNHVPVHTEDKIFYTEDNLHSFLTHRSWTCIRELDGYAAVDSLNELRPGAIYRGMN